MVIGKGWSGPNNVAEKYSVTAEDDWLGIRKNILLVGKKGGRVQASKTRTDKSRNADGHNPEMWAKMGKTTEEWFMYEHSSCELGMAQVTAECYTLYLFKLLPPCTSLPFKG